MSGKKWSQEEDEFLKGNYLQLTKPEIIKKIGRSWKSIRIRALSLGMNRRATAIKQSRNGNVGCLLTKSYNAYYWLGFLLADGHFSKRGCISLVLHKQDKNHLAKYAKFIRTSLRTSTKNRVIAEVQHPSICCKICNIFSIGHRKTYQCPNLPKMSDKQFIAFLVGLIDGDGNINKNCIRIKCHLSWAPFYQKVSDRIAAIANVPSVKVIKKKYMILNISNYDVLSLLRCSIDKLNIPLLERKWNKIDKNKKSKITKAKILNQEIHQLQKEGRSVSEIAVILNVSVSGVYSSLKRTYKYSN